MTTLREPRTWVRLSRCVLAAAVWVLVAVGCQLEPDPADVQNAIEPRVDVYFNHPGTRLQNYHENFAIHMLVQSIDRAQATIDFAAMGLSRPEVIAALERAWHRGVQLRFVGDARHAHGSVWGYEVLDRYNIPVQVGNQNHIMHNKFFIIDRFVVFLGTGNITGTDMGNNNNNWLLLFSHEVAQDFTDEFEQMMAGRFGAGKIPIDNGNRYQLGDTTVEVWFSPQEDAMGRLLECLEGAVESIEFSIFAFTKDQVGSALIAKHQEFQRYNLCCDPARAQERATAPVCEAIACEDEFRPRRVRGVVDQSQLHSNGPYHEIYRILAEGMEVRLDGNDAGVQPGDYQAGGGRLHAKTIVIDTGRPTARVVTGSFNWSAAATVSNDETMLVLHSERLALQYADYFQTLWRQGKPFGRSWIGDDSGLQAGDIVFNEIHWDGFNGDVDISDFGGDDVYNDEFIELLNTTDRPIDLSMWVIASDTDFVLGFYPGTVIGPRERFLIVDHNMRPFFDDQPHFFGGAFLDADFVMNWANDQRFLRLNLSNASLRLRLLDPRARVMDVAGDGGPPFAGGRIRDDQGVLRNYSMERVHTGCAPRTPDCPVVLDGTTSDGWQRCQREEGTERVRERFRSIVVATPGEANSGGETIGPPDPTFRRPPPRDEAVAP
jgi:hypothetical protein